jgi:hypothetical protein
MNPIPWQRLHGKIAETLYTIPLSEDTLGNTEAVSQSPTKLCSILTNTSLARHGQINLSSWRSYSAYVG